VGNQLVLASRSPQRRAILEALGVSFVVRPPEFEELESGPPEQVARHNALGKAQAVARSPGEVALGVDTVVTLAGRLYGKPVDAGHARDTLRALSGATHTVLSALALIGLAEHDAVTATAATQVSFAELDETTIEWYVRSGEWRERAGGYAVQGAGAALVAAIAGDWTNVVGLPVGALLRSYPALLAARNNRFSAQNQAQLQD
jgi:nucleoside triphosphate pyrophosphatase